MSLLSVGSVIDQAWHHYTTHFLELMSISAWLLVIAILNIVSSLLAPDTLQFSAGAGALSAGNITGIIIYGITFLLLAPIVSIWVSNRLIKRTDEQLAGKPLNWGSLNQFGWHYFFPRLLVGIMAALLLIAPLLLLAPGGALIGLASVTHSTAVSLLGMLLTFFGVIAAGVGCIYVAIKIFFTPFTLLLENHRGRAAVKASAALTRGRWWATFFRVAIPSVVFYIGVFTIQLVLLFVLRTVILSVAGLNVTFAIQLYAIGSSTLFIVLNTLMAPLVVSVNTIVFRNLQSSR